MERVLGIAERTVQHFGSDGYTDFKLPGQSFHAEKPVAETAMLLHASAGISYNARISERVHELGRFLVPYARSEGVLIELALRPALAFKFAVPHIVLSRLGFPDAEFDELLLECANAQVRNGVDRSPTAERERCWIRSLWRSDVKASEPAALLAHSVLGWPLDVLGGLRSDTYAFTHLMMYATDFGSRSVRLPRARDVVLDEAEALLARFVDSEDYDVAGELLLSWPFLGARWSPAAIGVFRLLTNLEDEVGILPGGLIDGGRLKELEERDRGIYALANSYHTAYVMGFLCAAALRNGRAPPWKMQGPRHAAALAKIQMHVQRDQGHYHDYFDGLPTPEKEALAPFFLKLAIAQCSRRRDYEAMRQVLKLAVEHGMASNAMCGQGAELLTRIGRCASAMGSRTTSRSKPNAALIIQNPRPVSHR